MLVWFKKKKRFWRKEECTGVWLEITLWLPTIQSKEWQDPNSSQCKSQALSPGPTQALRDSFTSTGVLLCEHHARMVRAWTNKYIHCAVCTLLILILSPLIWSCLWHFLLQIKFSYCHSAQVNKWETERERQHFSFHHLQISIEHILCMRHCSTFLGYLNERNRRVSLPERREAPSTAVWISILYCPLEGGKCCATIEQGRGMWKDQLGWRAVIVNRMVSEAV